MAKFVEFTQGDTATEHPVLINPDHVVSVTPTSSDDVGRHRCFVSLAHKSNGQIVLGKFEEVAEKLGAAPAPAAKDTKVK